jgi:predicted protein tyrosine phosphatase
MIPKAEVHGPYVGPGKSFLVLPREETARRMINEPHVVISIRDPEWKPVTMPTNPLRKGVLSLVFNDVDMPTIGKSHMSEEDGRKAVELVWKHPEASLVVVSCMRGYSRSPGVAAALSVWLNNDDKFFTQHYNPNPWCKWMVLRAVNRLYGIN